MACLEEKYATAHEFATDIRIGIANRPVQVCKEVDFEVDLIQVFVVERLFLH